MAKTIEGSNWEEKYKSFSFSRQTEEAQKKLSNFEESRKHGGFVELTKSALESEGFMYIPAKNIWIDPQKRIIRFTEPKRILGTEEFELRDYIEKQWPVAGYSLSVEAENQILRGIEGGEVEPFHPHLGGRICFHEIPIFETKESTFIPISILPDSGQKYSGHVKSLGSNLVRGRRFPRAEDLKKFARGRVKSSLDEIQSLNPYDKIISRSEHGEIRTGLWTVEFVRKKGEAKDVSRIENCHIARDSETGTFDIFHINKRYVFEMEEELRIWEEFSGPLKIERIIAIVTLENFKKAENGKPLKLEKVFYKGRTVKNLMDIPEGKEADKKYRHLFFQKEGVFYLKEYKVVPPTREFQQFESMIVEQLPEKSVLQMKQALGQLMEKLVGQMLRASKNKNILHIRVPKGEELENILKNQPEEFQNWARKMKEETLTVNPDFILKSKGGKDIFVEVKYSYPMAKESFKDQYYRMALYKLIAGEEPNIYVFSTEGPEGPHPDFPGVNFINIFEKKYRNQIDPKILQQISVYEEKLKKASKSSIFRSPRV